MSLLLIGALAFPVLFILMLLRVPIGLAMLLVGGLGYLSIRGGGPLLAHLQTGPFYTFSNYSLSVIPLFLLMGQFATQAGLSRALFNAAQSWLGHRRGGLAMATIAGCAGFGAICGSSLATAASMGQVALPEMRRHRYAGGLTTGVLAAGGTLGILIPPSIILIIYAILTEQNVASMFVAALIPGLLAVAGYIVAIHIIVTLSPSAGPVTVKASRSQRIKALYETWPVLFIFSLVIGGIYAGVFTPTEGAAVGAVCTGLLAYARGRLNKATFLATIQGTAGASGMIFLILLGADVFNSFLALTQLPVAAAGFVQAMAWSPFVVLMAILGLYLLLGCMMDSLSMILLTIPVFFPIIAQLDFGLTPDETLIWFGILALIVVEMGLITPPVGLNVFIISTLAKDISMSETFKGVLPFLLSDLIRVGLLIVFPSLSLGLLR